MKKTQESGRSMVEMLGVLAIIGVLSIGGIAGYSMAMNRYRANEALDMASKYAVILFAGKQTAVATGNSDYKIPSLYGAGLGTDKNKTSTTPGGATIATPSTIADDATEISLDITFQSDGVCRAAASILGVDGTCTSNQLTGVKFKQS